MAGENAIVFHLNYVAQLVAHLNIILVAVSRSRSQSPGSTLCSSASTCYLELFGEAMVMEVVVHFVAQASTDNAALDELGGSSENTVGKIR